MDTSTGAPHRVLLVEDDDSIADAYTQWFKNDGFEIVRASGGEQALKIAEDFKPDVVLLDVMMPKMSGFEVLKQLRGSPETAQLKIVVISALSQEQDRKEAIDLGADSYLVKSQITVADLTEVVRQLVH